MLRRIDAVMAARDGCHRTGREAATMGRGINTARESRGDQEARFTKLTREPFSELDTRRRGIACAHDRDRWPRQCGELAAYPDEGRRIVDHGKTEWIVRLAERYEADAHRLRGSHLALGLGACADPAWC